MNILGVIVKVLPEHMKEARVVLEESGLCEVFVEDTAGGRLVVTIEGEDDSEALRKLRKISTLKNILAADLIHVSSESDPDLVEGASPDLLNSGEDAANILYQGSVYHWLSKN